jgi:3-deoxy-7-phosphoheptulonate synthase
MIEVHDDPGKALSDGHQSLTPGQFERLVGRVRAVREVLK